MCTKITFLGTGGGRHTTMFQTRCTGGMLFEHYGKILHIDPGPGALTQMKRIHYDPVKTDSVLVSHAHPDHYSDAESVVEGMTQGGWKKKGCLYGSHTVICGEGTLGPCISKYHQSIVDNITVFKPNDVLEINDMSVDICTANHSDPTNAGFKFKTKDGIISYVSDTSYSDDIAGQYIGSRVLILPVTTPNDMKIPYHMCTDDAIKFVEIVKPELTVITHLGIVMIRSDPDIQAKNIENATDVKCIAGRDLMILNIGKDITVTDAETFEGLWIPPSSI